MEGDCNTDDSTSAQPVDDRVERALWLVEYLVSMWTRPTWSGPINEFVDAHCWQVHDSKSDEVLRELHSSYVGIAEPLLRQHLTGAHITASEFERIVAHTKDNPELTDVIPEHVTALHDMATFGKIMMERNMELDRETRAAMQQSDAVTPPSEPPIPDGESFVHQTTNIPRTASARELAMALDDSVVAARDAQSAAAIRTQRERRDVSVALAASLLDEAERKRAALQEEAELQAAIAASLTAAERAAWFGDDDASSLGIPAATVSLASDAIAAGCAEAPSSPCGAGSPKSSVHNGAIPSVVAVELRPPNENPPHDVDELLLAQRRNGLNTAPSSARMGFMPSRRGRGSIVGGQRSPVMSGLPGNETPSALPGDEPSSLLFSPASQTAAVGLVYEQLHGDATAEATDREADVSSSQLRRSMRISGSGDTDVAREQFYPMPPRTLLVLPSLTQSAAEHPHPRPTRDDRPTSLTSRMDTAGATAALAAREAQLRATRDRLIAQRRMEREAALRLHLGATASSATQSSVTSARFFVGDSGSLADSVSSSVVIPAATSRRKRSIAGDSGLIGDGVDLTTRVPLTNAHLPLSASLNPPPSTTTASGALVASSSSQPTKPADAARADARRALIERLRAADVLPLH